MERYRITSDEALYYVTFTVVEWLPVFVSEPPCKVVTDSLTYCQEQQGLRVNAFVIMPTHVHAILFHADYDSDRLLDAVTAFRKFTGRRLADFCDRSMRTCFSAAMRAAAGDDRERRFWQPTRHPEAIHSEPFWRRKFDYLHDNPRRKGLVREPAGWRLSSAAYWFGDQEAVPEVPLAPLEW